jgi:hypothetical protein
VTRHGRRVRRTRRTASAFTAALVLALASACSSGGNSAEPSPTTRTTTPPRTSGNATDDVRAAAVAWAHAFLTGTLQDIRNLQGPECRSPGTPKLGTQDLEGYLRALRLEMAHSFGRKLDQIAIRDVLERNVTSTSGEAEVQYELPESVAGNDNWVTFRVHDGQWKVANCNAPIGGRTTSATSQTT